MQCFAARWREALADDEAFAEAQWVATMICLLDGEAVPPDLPVQTIGIGDVIRLHERSLGVRRGRPDAALRATPRTFLPPDHRI